MKKEKVIKYVLLGISAILVVSIIIAMVVNSNNRQVAKEEEETTNNKNTTNNYIVHKSYDEKFNISAPTTYKEIDDKQDLNKKAIIELNDEDKSSYVLVIVTPKENYNSGFSEYKKDVFKQREDFFDTKITRYNKVTIDEHEAEYGEIYYTNPSNINLYIRSYALETDNYFGQMVLWTLAANEKSVQNEFDKIASSFIELDKKD